MRIGACAAALGLVAAARADVTVEKDGQMKMRLQRPLNLMVTHLFNDVPATANFTWPGAREPARRGKALVYSYLNFEDEPPQITYKNVLDNNQNIIGLYVYTPGLPGQPPSTEAIEIKNGLSQELEFYVAVHELLHFGGFGTTHGLTTQVLNDAKNVYLNEFSGVAQGDPTINSHWDSVSGTHIRSGQPASAEVMTPVIGGQAFLAAATLKACTRQLKVSNPGNYCISDDMCPDQNSVCMLGQSTTPGHCNGTHVDVGWPHETADDDAFLAIIISVCILFVFIMIGIMISWLETSYTVYETVPGRLPL